MNTAQNQRHMETEKRLKEALLYYMERNQEPTVGQLCDYSGINRSTFYRHYTDVYDFMMHVEQELQHGLYQSLHSDTSFIVRMGSDPDSLIPLISYIGQNAHFYRVYLNKLITIPHKYDESWNDRIKPLFNAYGVTSERHMKYYYEFIRFGLIKTLLTWLDDGCVEKPEELSNILFEMLPIKPAISK